MSRTNNLLIFINSLIGPYQYYLNDCKPEYAFSIRKLRHINKIQYTKENEDVNSHYKYDTNGSIFAYLHSFVNINLVMDEFEALLQNESFALSCAEVDQLDIMDQVDTVLDPDSDVEIPGALLQNLDKLGRRVQLKEETGYVVRNNFAVLMADGAPGSHVRGFRIAAAHNDAFNKDMFQFVNGSSYYLSAEETDAMTLLPESVMQAHRRVSFVALRTDQAFHHNRSCELNSVVLGVSVENFTGFNQGEMVEIYLSPKSRTILRNQSRACAYWRFEENGNGYWSQDGCTLTVSKENQLDVCHCDHLTHFAQILVAKTVFSELNEKILQIISLVGCSVSIFGITLVAITAAVFEAWRKNDSNKVWLHLCSAVFLLNVCFLLTINIEFDQTDISCAIVGAALHYSVLATYCWMLVISIFSYRKLVLVFTKDIRYKLLLSSLFCWGFPMLVIGILLAVDSTAYSGRFEEITQSGHFCYPRHVALWVTVYLPIAVMWFINWCLYGIIIRSMMESRKSNIRRHSNSKDNLRSASVSCLLAFICGIPWVSGFFARNIVAAYIFTITVTFQGFVLFLFFIVGSKTTRDLWINLFRVNLHGEYRATSLGTTNRSQRTQHMWVYSDESSVPLGESSL